MKDKIHHVNVRGSVETTIHPDPDLAKKNDAEQHKQDSRDSIKLGVEIATLILVFAYTTVAFWQTLLTRTAITDARKQFSEQQRPYVWQPVSTAEKPNVDFFIPYPADPAQPIKTTMLYQNYGVSPAIVTRFAYDVEIGPDAFKKLRHIGWQNITSVLPPGKSDYLDMFSADKITKANFADATKPGGVATLVQMQYQDTSGRSFESDICFMMGDQKGVATYCPPELNFNRLLDCAKDACTQ